VVTKVPRLHDLIRKVLPFGPEPLNAEQRGHWEDFGYLVLPRFFAPEQLQIVNQEVDACWQASRKGPSELVIDLISTTGARIKLHDAPVDTRRAPYKLNDLYLVSDRVRQIVLDTRLVAILRELLGGAPLVCNTLNLEYGSQQPCHTDSLYMTPPRGLNLVASWIALEDCDVDAGPLRYYPASHKIPPFRFSDGRITAREQEMPGYQAYMRQQIESMELKEERFCAKAGDLFIWHSQLYHGGAAIEDPMKSRRSLVTHYFLATDMPKHMRVRQVAGGYWLKRAHQPVPDIHVGSAST
jgi:ectoine hydroxylase-related dioxygenase (phytanoyl-CoA dioxygenase family)